MKKLMMIGTAAVLAASMSGCLLVSANDINGMFAQDHTGARMLPIDNSVKPLKCGRAKATGILGITSGDCSINAAMKDGGITKVHHVDYHAKNILGIVGEFETQVWGE